MILWKVLLSTFSLTSLQIENKKENGGCSNLPKIISGVLILCSPFPFHYIGSNLNCKIITIKRRFSKLYCPVVKHGLFKNQTSVRDIQKRENNDVLLDFVYLKSKIYTNKKLSLLYKDSATICLKNSKVIQYVVL